ncbi:MAG: A/G-specific adenine glycosylase [Bacteroidota bacterium]
MDFVKARNQLLRWYDQAKRELPWRDIDNSYFTWVSEIMLQQTRVDQATPYFLRFIEHFPTVEDLAKADQQEVLKVWEGLGYYSRARNMHHAAQTVVNEFDGSIPDTYDEITQLKGIGPYTAAAVLSIAFNKPHAVVDGNVLRVITRLMGNTGDIRKTTIKNEVQEFADNWLDPERCGDFNQAVMELGATVCTPSNPDCENCPLQEHCTAYKTVQTDQIPYKSPAKKRPHHQIAVGVVKDEDDKVLIALRPDDAMLGGMWEFPGGKQEKGETLQEAVKRELKEELGIVVEVQSKIMSLNHSYSHFKITLHAYFCSLIDGDPTPDASQEVRWVAIDELDDYPFPKANRKLTETLVQGGQVELNI